MTEISRGIDERRLSEIQDCLCPFRDGFRSLDGTLLVNQREPGFFDEGSPRIG